MMSEKIINYFKKSLKIFINEDIDSSFTEDEIELIKKENEEIENINEFLKDYHLTEIFSYEELESMKRKSWKEINQDIDLRSKNIKKEESLIKNILFNSEEVTSNFSKYEIDDMNKFPLGMVKEIVAEKIENDPIISKNDDQPVARSEWQKNYLKERGLESSFDADHFINGKVEKQELKIVKILLKSKEVTSLFPVNELRNMNHWTVNMIKNVLVEQIDSKQINIEKLNKRESQKDNTYKRFRGKQLSNRAYQAHNIDNEFEISF